MFSTLRKIQPQEKKKHLKPYIRVLIWEPLHNHQPPNIHHPTLFAQNLHLRCHPCSISHQLFPTPKPPTSVLSVLLPPTTPRTPPCFRPSRGELNLVSGRLEVGVGGLGGRKSHVSFCWSPWKNEKSNILLRTNLNLTSCHAIYKYIDTWPWISIYRKNNLWSRLKQLMLLILIWVK